MVEDVSSTAHGAYQRLHASGEFVELKRAYLGFVVPVTIGFMLWYFLYVVLSNWAPGFMGTKLIGNVNVALVFGLLQFLTTFAIAWAYQRFSARRMDPLADHVRDDFEREVGA
ncbi:MAG TPA: DUF485 domain-containing protein [Aeromicrobium sp.]|nr:DUF485 domain-containing protein [Aeromicrobium sp.]